MVRDRLDAPGDPAADTNRPQGHLKSGRARAAFFGAGWSFVNTMASTLATAVIFLVSSRFLVSEDFGTVALASSIVALVGGLTPLGFGESLIQRSDLRDRHLDTVFWGCLVAAAGAALLLLLLAPTAATLTGVSVLAVLLPFVGLRLVFDLIATVPLALVTRAMNFRAVALRTFAANGIGGIVCVWMVLAGYGLWALAASQVVIAGVGLLVLSASARWRPGLKISRRAVADLWSYGIFSSGSRLINDMRLDQLVLGILAGPALLGYYFFARRVFEMLAGLTVGALAPVSHVLFATMQRERDKRKEAFALASYASTMITFPVFVGVFAIAETAIPLIFGTHWTGAIPAVKGLSAIGVLAGLGIVQAALVRSQGRADWWFWYEAGVQLSAVAIVALLHDEGLPTLMVALVAHRIVVWPISIAMTLRLLGTGPVDYLLSLAGPATAAMLMGGTVSVLPVLLPDIGPWYLLLMQAAAGAGVYVFAVMAISGQRFRALLATVSSSRILSS